MVHILHIETSSELCSVALSINDKCIDLELSNEKNAQSTLLTVMIDDILKRNNLSANQLQAVAVSKGPGSYTGLRIGVSTAKGLAFALDIPLLSVDTLKCIAQKAKEQIADTDKYIIASVSDARRMEVYYGFYDQHCNSLSPVNTEILEVDSFASMLNASKTYFVGSGAAKSSEIITHKNAHFLLNIQATADAMVHEAYLNYTQQKFEDIAYFEPFYLKEFYNTSK